MLPNFLSDNTIDFSIDQTISSILILYASKLSGTQREDYYKDVFTS